MLKYASKGFDGKSNRFFARIIKRDRRPLAETVGARIKLGENHSRAAHDKCDVTSALTAVNEVKNQGGTV
ncbi:MAG: hypothetical protein IIY18_05360 [Clostridia bacterium]|nr:hypothetical protein [Clostridia bacterium]